jgi:hypothetical protein
VKLATFSASTATDRFIADFCGLPGRVRQGRYRVGLLPSETWRLFLSAPFPFAHEFWLCYRHDRTVGRIGANVSATYPEVGFFGFFELELQADYPVVADALLTSACDWLRAKQVKQIIGPVDFSTWFPYRFRLDDGDQRIFAWEPVNPPEYTGSLEAAALEVADQYSSTAFGDLSAVINKLEPAYRHALEAGYSFRDFGRAEIDADLPALYRISLDAFRDNYLFEPISEALFAQLYVNIADKEKDNASWFVIDPAGDEVGFLYAFVDQWRQAGRTETAVVLKGVAVAAAAGGRGLSNALIYLALTEGLRMGAEYAISALVRSGIQSESYARKGAFLWRHDYGLWRKMAD